MKTIIAKFQLKTGSSIEINVSEAIKHHTHDSDRQNIYIENYFVTDSLGEQYQVYEIELHKGGHTEGWFLIELKDKDFNNIELESTFGEIIEK